MTVSSDLAKQVYVVGEGGTPPYPVPFPFLDNSHVEVIHRDAAGVETTWVESTQYTLTGAGDAAGGTLTIVTSPVDYSLTTGESLTIRRNVPFTQETDYQEAGRFPAESHERALDKLTMIAQQQAEAIARALSVPGSDQAGAMELPIDSERAGRFLAFDDNGLPIAAAGTSADLAPVSAFMDSLLDAGDAAAARETLGLGDFDLDSGAALPWRFFTVADAPSAYVGDGGGPYDIGYMNGVWLTYNLYWDQANGCLSRVEASKDETALAIQIATSSFPDTAGSYRAVTIWRVQGTAVAAAAQTPDRLVSPTAASVGGLEMIETFTDQGQRASGGSTDEQDGDGAAHGYARRVHVKLSDDGSTAVWFTGFVVNSYAAGDGTDADGHPSLRWGLRQTLDVSSGDPASYATTKTEFVIQQAPATAGAPAFADIAATRLDTIDTTAAHSGLLLKGATTTYGAPLSNGVKPAVNHYLNGEPDFIKVVLVCETADLGYSVGERAMIGPWSPVPGNSGGTTWSSWGLSFLVTATQLQLALQDSIYLPRKDTSAIGAVAASKWSLEVTPFRLAVD